MSLARIAREAIARALEGVRARPSPDPPVDAERRGVFVTLRRREDGELRGCIGFVEALLPLHEAVSHAAVGAALRDRRFRAVTRAELPALAVHVSVLGTLRLCRPEEVEIGRHGVVIRCRARRALLLPQVAVEQGWDRETLLRELCRKAGLPVDAWRDGDGELLVFETETFAD